LLALWSASCATPEASENPERAVHVRRPRADVDLITVFGEEFMKALRDGDDEAALRHFAPHLRQHLTLERFAASRQALTQQFGRIVSWRLVAKVTDHEKQLREYELQCSRPSYMAP
jgi:hypothetical protein